METLAEKLEKYLENRKITIAALAKNCRIDRSTMFQYIHGTRPLKNRDHLEQIMNRLTLTLSEREELTELFEIEKIGYEVFYRRKKIEKFIRSLPSLSEKSKEAPWKQEAHKKYITANTDLDPDSNMKMSPGYISNHLELSQTLFFLLCHAHKQQDPVEILMQPKESSLLELLLYPAFGLEGMKVSHILCLDDFKNDHNGSNIDRYHILIRYFLLLGHYEPVYFYGNTKERFGISNPFPYFICSRDWALQISADENTGILHADPAGIQGFHSLFSKIASCCQTLGTALCGLNSEISWYASFVNPDLFQDAIELCTGLCSTQFWDQKLIETYLNPLLPEAEELKNQLAQYCRTLYEVKRVGKIRLLLNPSYVLDFIKTGIFKEYPEIFFTSPLNKEDRKIILERVLTACEEGCYQISFLKESMFPLQYRWEMCVNNDLVTIQYFHLQQFRTLFIKEHGFVSEMYGYLEALWENNETLSGAAAMELLKTWMKQYLN